LPAKICAHRSAHKYLGKESIAFFQKNIHNKLFRGDGKKLRHITQRKYGNLNVGSQSSL
jgi:hypothetical protein